jgi:O-antigen/teichoic acid export membrane protein
MSVLEDKIKLPAGYADVGRVLSGTLARNGLRGLLKLVIAPLLGPQQLGTLSSVFWLFKTMESLVDLGLDYATVTFVPAARQRGDAEEQTRTFRVVLALKLAIATALLVVGNLLAPWVAVTILSDPALTIWVRLVFLAVGGQLLWKYLSSFQTARQRFTRLALYLITAPLVMFAATLVLIALGRFSLTAAILIYLFAPLVTVIVWWCWIERDAPWRPLWDGPLARRIVGFSRWPYLSSVASANRNNVSPLLLKNAALSGSVAAGELSAGLYSFGNDMASELTVVSQSLVSVLLPKASMRTDPRELRRFVQRSYLHLSLLIGPLALLMLVTRPALLLLGRFEPRYLEFLPSLGVFYVLYSGALLSLAAIPIQTALYALRRPQIETYIELALAPVLIGGSILLIPRYGALGVATMVLVQRTIAFAVLIGYGWIRISRDASRGVGG